MQLAWSRQMIMRMASKLTMIARALTNNDSGYGTRSDGSSIRMSRKGTFSSAATRSRSACDRSGHFKGAQCPAKQQRMRSDTGNTCAPSRM